MGIQQWAVTGQVSMSKEDLQVMAGVLLHQLMGGDRLVRHRPLATADNHHLICYHNNAGMGGGLPLDRLLILVAMADSRLLADVRPRVVTDGNRLAHQELPVNMFGKGQTPIPEAMTITFANHHREAIKGKASEPSHRLHLCPKSQLANP